MSIFQILPLELGKPFKDQVKDNRCRWCGVSLKNERILHYDHSGGWKVKGFKELQWLYIHCPHCGYDWALWKLGVSRDFCP